MVKELDATYDAGRRGGAWRKVKPVHTLDLVVIAVEWGHGRRTGWLSNLHLGARGGDGEFVMVGKTFKGMTDDAAALADRALPELKLGEGTGARVTSSTSGRNRSSRSPSTACRCRRAIRAGLPCGSPACAATATTSRPPRPTRSSTFKR